MASLPVEDVTQRGVAELSLTSTPSHATPGTPPSATNMNSTSSAIASNLTTINNTITALSGSGRPTVSLASLPNEILTMIFEPLLTSPALGDIGSLYDNWSDLRLELTPGLLGTCRQFYEVAWPMLYEQNVFIIECTGDMGMDGSRVPRCALTRKLDTTSFRYEDNSGSKSPCFFGFESIPSFKNILNWKVLVDDSGSDNGPDPRFSHFCQTLSWCQLSDRMRVVSLDVDVFSRNMNPRGSQEDAAKIRVSATTKIITSVLRNITVRVQQAQRPACIRGFVCCYNIPNVWVQNRSDVCAPSEEICEMVDKCQSLVRSNDPVEKAFLMHQNLFTYAQAFKSEDALKGDMIQSMHYPQRRSGYGVEIYLARAYDNVNAGDNDSFKENRHRVVRRLLPQYQQISSSIKRLHGFIASQKAEDGILDPRSDYPVLSGSRKCNEKYWQKALRLVKWAVSDFERDVGNRFDDIQRSSTRARLLSELEVHCDTANKPHLPELRRLPEMRRHVFKELVDSLASQFLSIREAHKHLYDHDLVADTWADYVYVKEQWDQEIDWEYS